MTTALPADTREYAWRIEQGERERLAIPVSKDGAPQDLTGWTVDVQIKDRKGGTLLYTFPAEQIAVSGSTVTLTVPVPVSAAWTWTVGWWRMVVTAPDPDPDDPDSSRVIQGPILVDRD